MSKISRREVLKGSTALLAAAPFGISARASSSTRDSLPGVLNGDQLFADVSTYSQFGVHHTGKEPDRATSNWQFEHLRSQGFSVSRHPFEVQQFFEDESWLELADGGRVFVAPQWPAVATPVPISGPIVDVSAADIRGGIAILLLDRPNRVVDIPEILAPIEDAFERGAAAVILVCEHASGRVQFGNVAESRPPWKGPVVLAGSADRERIRAAAGARGRLAVFGSHRKVTAENVRGMLERGDRWVVVSTPQSGWTTCAGERGPGVAYFRALATAAAALEGGPSWCFLSNSGHELDNFGARIAHESGSLPRPEDTALWVHLGAGIAQRDAATRDGGGIQLLDDKSFTLASCDWRRAWTVFQHFWGTSTVVVPYQWWAVGELTEVIGHGYRNALGLAAAATYHHVPGDLPETTSSTILASMGDALWAALSDLIDADSPTSTHARCVQKVAGIGPTE
jgi:hypothetical protein